MKNMLVTGVGGNTEMANIRIVDIIGDLIDGLPVMTGDYQDWIREHYEK